MSLEVREPGAKEFLQATRAVIQDPAHWGKRTYARSSDGWPCSVYASDAYQFCLMGAIYRVNKLGKQLAVNRLCAALHKSSEHNINIMAFNDHPDTSHEDVMNLLDAAIAACEKDETNDK